MLDKTEGRELKNSQLGGSIQTEALGISIYTYNTRSLSSSLRILKQGLIP